MSIFVFLLFFTAVRGQLVPDCRGVLSPKSCVCEEKMINCYNGGYDTTEVFLNLAPAFPHLEVLNMTGNTFANLESDLFNLHGSESWPLRELILTDCKIAVIHKRAFINLPKLVELTLNNNRISFYAQSTVKAAGGRTWATGDFLSPLADGLRELDLSNAFDPADRLEKNLQFMANMTDLLNIDLPQLQYLDLSCNNIARLSPTAFAQMPQLQYVYLQNNSMNTFSMCAQCGPNLIHLNLTSNYIRRLDDDFMQMVDDRRILKEVFLHDNPFTCDCESRAFIKWLRMTQKVQDKNAMQCAKAKPRDFVDKALTTVQEDKLQCASDASEYLHGVYILCGVAMVGLIAMLMCVLYANRAVLCKNTTRTWLPMGGYQVLGREPEVKAEMV